ncbi:hypothetical protein GOP47_0001178 [Adiantum capillus-veneris]|uniref:Dolichyl-diphosphooligosaccharide--protein glycosyltransferase subunit 3B n=1 Tax=Adiantum capillus-veneris TaxID=13818 RepID=A0A9D4VFA5_ADICA|nr:hypothetical protein GOP47_0001178 [Adiantum capillus-veneris]
MMKTLLLSSGGLLVCAFLFAVALQCSADSNAERISALLDLQSRSADGVIRFDDGAVQRFIQEIEVRPYSLIVFFDALQLRDNSDLRLADLRREFGLLASAYIRHNEGTPAASKVFFVDLEFKQSQRSFSLFAVNSLPHIRHIAAGSSSFKDVDAMEPSDFSRQAEGMSSFVESRTKQKVGTIERPPPVTRKQLIILVGGLLAVAPFILKKVLAGNTLLHDPKVWTSFSLFVYFFSVSGGMHNIIRSMPLFMADRNNPGKLVFFYQASGMQLGAEGFTVGSLYMVFGLALAYITHFLPRVKSQTTQRTVMVTCMVIGFWVVRQVIYLDNWKTGYSVHGYWPNNWR